MNLRIHGGLDDLVLCGIREPIGNVIIDGVVEQHGVLWNYANGLMQAVLSDIPQILPVNDYGAAGYVIKSEQKPADRRLA